MATAGDLVRRALRLTSVLTRGETPAAEDTSEALEALNDLMHEWYADDILVPFLTREELALTSGKASYTIGTGADLDTVRPMSIRTLVLRDGDRDYPLREISQRWFAEISLKQETEQSDRFYYEEGYPNGTLYLDTKPDQNYPIFMTSYKPHSDLASLATTLDLPPMYEKALAFNLAVDLAPEYGKEAPQTVIREAEHTRRIITQRNMGNRPVELAVDYSLTNRNREFDIRGDE